MYGYFIKWDPQEIYYHAIEKTAFEASTERTPGTYSKYSSIDDKIDMIHYYTTLVKFGLGRASYDAAQEIVPQVKQHQGIGTLYLFNEIVDECPAN